MTKKLPMAVSPDLGNEALKQYTDEQFQHLEKLTNEKFRSRDEALVMQAEEYARRLSDLNGEAARLREIQATYVPREVYDDKMEEMEKKVELLVAVNLKDQGKTSWEKYVPWAIALAAVGIAYFKPK